MVQHGQDLPRIAHPISEAPDSSTIDLVETLKDPAPSIKTPEDELPLTDES